eukprot:CAMPEP_0197535100 /NCGR_PEP_ID=MMETSP1318-20131121/49443_1 /TAXON_ID=552666 /ORGANISM="Partenskyella glossopodia, Strain RCC365" /LENGTH=255 /DNA_ID=CAMNT_0043092587 /DNA_START=331 /DNA_END=1098 /DNA_ORIENTATION=-
MIELSSEQYADDEPLQCRTGRDDMEETTGGQPLTLSVHFMYQIDRENVPLVYTKFGLNWHQRFTDFSRQAISDTAQKYTPYQFWGEREKVALAMKAECEEWLMRHGQTKVTMFQLTQIGFHSMFERMIVDIQLQVQLYVTREYHQHLVRVMKEIDIMESVAHAEILAINAWAIGNASVILANATNTGFNVTQESKGYHYRKFADTLSLSSKQLVKYVKTVSIGGHVSKDLVMGMDYPFPDANDKSSGAKRMRKRK